MEEYRPPGLPDSPELRVAAYKEGRGEFYDYLRLLKENEDIFEDLNYVEAINDGMRQLYYPTDKLKVRIDVRNNVATLVELVLYHHEHELVNKDNTPPKAFSDILFS